MGTTRPPHGLLLLTFEETLLFCSVICWSSAIHHVVVPPSLMRLSNYASHWHQSCNNYLLYERGWPFDSLVKLDVTESGMLFWRVMGTMYTSIGLTILTKTLHKWGETCGLLQTRYNALPKSTWVDRRWHFVIMVSWVYCHIPTNEDKNCQIMQVAMMHLKLIFVLTIWYTNVRVLYRIVTNSICLAQF